VEVCLDAPVTAFARGRTLEPSRPSRRLTRACSRQAGWARSSVRAAPSDGAAKET
jgi:hypothetical protein